MFNSVALEVVIGLVFIYLLYSLLATTIQELLASLLKLRATMLEKAIKRMLDDGGTEKFSKEFKGHALIKYFIRDEATSEKKNSLPSYITSQNFSKVVIDILKKDGAGNNTASKIKDFINQQEKLTSNDPKLKIGKDTLSLIKSFAEEVNYDMDKFKVSLEQWFDDMMERVSGWYKRKSQVWLFFIGMTVAIMFNVDTIGIVKKLSHDKDGAKALADMASNYVKTHKEPPLGTQFSSTNSDSLFIQADYLLKGQIKDANSVLGLGYDSNPFSCTLIRSNGPWHYILKFVGWLITALSVCLGAPFWFDMLKKLVNVRGAGSNPDEDKKASTVKASEVPIIKIKG